MSASTFFQVFMRVSRSCRQGGSLKVRELSATHLLPEIICSYCNVGITAGTGKGSSAGLVEKRSKPLPQEALAPLLSASTFLSSIYACFTVVSPMRQSEGARTFSDAFVAEERALTCRCCLWRAQASCGSAQVWIPGACASVRILP